MNKPEIAAYSNKQATGQQSLEAAGVGVIS
jgi:hypothetical protein